MSRQRKLQPGHQFAKLLRCAVNIQHRMIRVRCKEQREAMSAHFDMRILVGVRPGDVNAWQINADVRHVITVAE